MEANYPFLVTCTPISKKAVDPAYAKEKSSF